MIYKPVKYSKYYGIIIAYLLFYLILYSNGPTFDFEEAERESRIIKPSKAPFLLLAAIFLLFYSIKENNLNFKSISNYKLWIIYFGINFLLVFLRNNIIVDINNFGLVFFSYLIFFLVIRYVYLIPPDLFEKYFIYVSISICIVAAIWHVLQGHKILFFPDRSEGNFERLGGLFYYAHTGALTAITFIFSVKRFREKKESQFILIAIISGILLIATDTRSAWFASFFSLIIIYFHKIKFYKLFILSILAYILSTSYSAIIGSNTSVAASADDSNYRMHIWLFALNIASKSLITGYGGDHPMEKANFILNDNLHDPHNAMISLLLQGGLISLVLYMTIFFSNCYKNINSYNNTFRFLFFFWFFFPFFWGHLYNHLSGFMNMYILFTIYAFALNPNYDKWVTVK